MALVSEFCGEDRCVFRRRSDVQISDSYPNQFPHLEVSQIGCEKIVSRSGFGFTRVQQIPICQM